MKGETRKFAEAENRTGSGEVSRFALRAALISMLAAPARAALPSDGFDVLDAINCKLGAKAYARFKRYFEFNAEEVARKFQWKRLSLTPQRSDYELPALIHVAGAYGTRRIGFMGMQVFAVLEFADAEAIAEREGIEGGPGKTRRGGFMKERILSRTTQPPGEDGYGWRHTIARVVWNDSNPGETFYGCSYRIEALDKGKAAH